MDAEFRLKMLIALWTLALVLGTLGWLFGDNLPLIVLAAIGLALLLLMSVFVRVALRMPPMAVRSLAATASYWTLFVIAPTTLALLGLARVAPTRSTFTVLMAFPVTVVLIIVEGNVMPKWRLLLGVKDEKL